MRNRFLKVASVLLVALILMAQTSPKNATIIYAPTNPTTTTCRSGQMWQNTSASTLFGCNVAVNPPVYQSLGSAGPAVMSFPITATSGATTVSATGLPVAQTASYFLSNATEVAGWNAALGAGLGAALFASNATDIASVGIDLNAQMLSLTYTGAGGLISNIQIGPATYLAVFTNPDEGTVTTHTFGEASELRSEDEGAPSNFGRVFVSQASAIMGVENAGNHAKITFGAQQIIQEVLTSGDFVRTDVSPDGPSDDTGGTKPTCDSSTRRRRWFTENGAGVADTYEVCMKSSLDTYAWVVIAVNP